MRNPTPHVSGRYGAPMRRGWPHLTPELAQTVLAMYESNPPQNANEVAHRQAALGVLAPKLSGKVSLRKIRINQGGYDDGGAYWGIGSQLWNASNDDLSVNLWFRARTRDAAKDQVLVKFPAARFYR